MIGQGFTEPAVRGYEPIIKENIDILCKTLLNGDGAGAVDSKASKGWSPPMNMSKYGEARPQNLLFDYSLTFRIANYLSFDIMSDVTFSVTRHLIEKPEYRWITSCIETMMDRIGVLSMVPWARWWGFGFHWLIRPAGLVAYLKFSGEAQYFIKTRMGQTLPEGRRDVYQNLEKAKDPETGRGLSPSELHSEAGVLIVAGECIEVHPSSQYPTRGLTLSRF